MKKIIVFTGYYVPYIGGLSSHAHEFNLLLAKKNYKIIVFTTQLPQEALQYENHKNLKIIRFPAFEIIPNYPLPKIWNYTFWKQYFSLFKQDPDFIISRIRFFNTSLLALIYIILKRKKLIHIEHTSNYAILSSKLKTTVAKYYDKTIGFLIFKKSTINISISQAVHDYIKQFDNRKSPIIYRGLMLKEIDKIQPSKDYKHMYRNKTIIATASRLYKWKGIEYTIEAINNLPNKIKRQVIFLIIGDGEDYEKLSKLQSQNVILIGQKSRVETLQILKIVDIYIHSSMPGGGLSTSLLEAMYTNCAIIATPNEGANEVIRNNINGFLINEPFIKNISLSIEELIINKNKQYFFQKQAHETIEQNFNWEKSIKKYENLFQSLYT